MSRLGAEIPGSGVGDAQTGRWRGWFLRCHIPRSDCRTNIRAFRKFPRWRHRPSSEFAFGCHADGTGLGSIVTFVRSFDTAPVVMP